VSATQHKDKHNICSDTSKNAYSIIILKSILFNYYFLLHFFVYVSVYPKVVFKCLRLYKIITLECLRELNSTVKTLYYIYIRIIVQILDTNLRIEFLTTKLLNNKNSTPQ